MIRDDALDGRAAEDAIDARHLLVDALLLVFELALGLAARHRATRPVIDGACARVCTLFGEEDRGTVVHRAWDEAGMTRCFPSGAREIRVTRGERARRTLTVNEAFLRCAIGKSERLFLDQVVADLVERLHVGVEDFLRRLADALYDDVAVRDGKVRGAVVVRPVFLAEGLARAEPRKLATVRREAPERRALEKKWFAVCQP